MDSREVRNLMEAYIDVYAPQEFDEPEGNEIDEGLRSAVKRLLGGRKKEEEEQPKPMSRGDQLRKKYNVGPEKSDTSAKRQILDRTRARAERDERDYGNSKYSKSVAQQSADAHDRYLRAGYSKYGANDPRGSGNRARRRAAVLQNNEFEWLIDSLLDEGYDLSDYTWDEMYEAYTELVEADPLAAMTPATFLKPKEPGQQFASPRRGPGGGRIPPSMGPTRTGANVLDLTSGETRNISRGRRLPTEPKTTKMVKKDGKWVKVEEVFDVVLAHLVNEGYANDFDSARKIMVNMSEDWIHSIIETN